MTGLPGCCVHKYRRDVETCPYCELNEADVEVERLRAALEKYGAHHSGCPYSLDEYERRSHGWQNGAKCTCGLAEALKGAEEEKE